MPSCSPGVLRRRSIGKLKVSYYRRDEVKWTEAQWTEALRQAASLSGFVVLNFRNESETIKDIVKNVTRLLGKTNLFVANNPVGVESRVNDIIQLLDRDIQQSNDVLLLGMWGCGFMKMCFLYYQNKLEQKLLRGWL
ncbi:hypothetical protein P8452_54746 [Trifolium repens]|nr:hypothetical protein P8452_54746 [Trifolium repens]